MDKKAWINEMNSDEDKLKLLEQWKSLETLEK